MRIPLGETTIGYVSKSQYTFFNRELGCHLESYYFHTNDMYEKIYSYEKMTYRAFKEKYPIASERYNWLRYRKTDYPKNYRFKN